MPIWVEDLSFEVLIKLAEEEEGPQEGRQGWGERKIVRQGSCRSQRGRMGDDDDVIPHVSIFKLPGLNEKGQLQQGRSCDLTGRDPWQFDGLGHVRSRRPKPKDNFKLNLGLKRGSLEMEEGSEEKGFYWQSESPISISLEVNGSSEGGDTLRSSFKQ